MSQLMAEPQTRFAGQTAWLGHLDRLGFNALDVTPEPADRFAGHRFASRPDPVRGTIEGALWGSVQAHKFLRDAVVLSDDAGRFNVGRHALCWVHAERLVYKLDTCTDRQRAAQARVRGLRRLTALLGISPLRGLIWGAGSKWPDTRSFSHSTTTSELEFVPPDWQWHPHFCPCCATSY